jgi:hypothetical protein
MKYIGAASIWMMAFIVTVVFAQSGLTQETKRIRFALTTPPHFLPIWVAKDLGLFSKHGLDVEVIFMRGGKSGGRRCYASGVSTGFGSCLFDQQAGNQDGCAVKGQSNCRYTTWIDDSLLSAFSL